MVVRRDPPWPPQPGSSSPPVGIPSFGFVGGCATLRLAESLSGVPITQDQPEIEDWRDRYLSQTLIGRYIIDVFYRNEKRLQDRGKALTLSSEERALAQALYTKYVGEAKLLLANPDRKDLRVRQEHTADAEAFLATFRRYLRADETKATDKLLELVRAKMLPGLNARDGLALLDDERLFTTVRKVVSTVAFLDTA